MATKLLANGLNLHSCENDIALYGAGGNVIVIPKAYIPALLTALEAAAQGMGVETGQAELVKACKALLAAFEGYEMLAALPIDVAEKARAAIAKAEQ